MLSTSGHIQALVNPPAREPLELPRRRDASGEPRGVGRAGGHAPGSWWPDYDEWLAERSGELKPAAKRSAAASTSAGKAPGTYVHAN